MAPATVASAQGTGGAHGPASAEAAAEAPPTAAAVDSTAEGTPPAVETTSAAAPLPSSAAPPPPAEAPAPTIDFSWARGITLADKADLFELNIRFRTQNRFTYESHSEDDLAPSSVEGIPRRLRLRLDGHAVDPRLLYRVQLSFTRGDQDWDNAGVPNVVRDAVITWKQNKHVQVLFGQTKLPGNRQRVISSGEQQFVDRSIVNATYNIDRDTGLQLHLAQDLAGMHLRLRTALTYGEGRNGGISPANTGGMAYTGRFEIMPLGEFEGGGDNFEGDLLREQTLKLAFAATYSHNDRTNRTGGQIGRALYAPVDIDTVYVDALAKFRGFALYAEYVWRDTKGTPVTTMTEGDETLQRFVHVGTGWMVQASYFVTEKLEIGGRHATILPRSDIRQLTREVAESTGVVTYYLQGHRVKVQTDVTFINESAPAPLKERDRWMGRFQIELGI